MDAQNNDGQSDDARGNDAQARSRALSSPIRLRVLRLCRFDARTNKELAELLDINPGTMLHHVRTLVAAGFLAAEPERAGAQGAREVPYRATGTAWNTPLDETMPALIETIGQQAALMDPSLVWLSWLGLRLSEENKHALLAELTELAHRYKDMPPEEGGEALSFSILVHPDVNPPGAHGSA